MHQRSLLRGCGRAKAPCLGASAPQPILLPPVPAPSASHAVPSPLGAAARSPVIGSVRAAGIARDIFTTHADSIEGDPRSFLQVTEAYWEALRNSTHEPHKKGPTVVRVAESGEALGPVDYDVVVCGGTLGLMVGATLARAGHKVAVVDKRLIQGRTQEWNISRGELQSLVRVGLLSEAELESCIVSEFNPVRVGFAGGEDIWVNDCLNLGVSPRRLLELVKAKFVEAGGELLENHSFRSADVVPEQGVKVSLLVHGEGTSGAALGVGDVNRPNGLGGNSSNFAPPFTPVDSTGRTPSPARPGGGRRKMELRARLLLDCMGHYSDIVKQMRGRSKPDGMVLVVGSCAEGFPTATNTYGDLLYTIDNAKDDMQMFWEAFPAEGGASRTTYMFAYSDAEPERPSFEALLDRYFTDLQKYQGVPLDQLRFKRVLFGGFPCWSRGPLKPQWDHIMQIGDASATQSPLSFGGFGAMLRHLPRLAEGLDDALRCGALSRGELAWMHPYQPSLSSSWLFQRSMSLAVGQLHDAMAATGGAGAPGAPRAPVQLPVNHVNEVLGVNFSVMRVLGDRVLRPFLQDTIQLVPLSLTMTGMMLRNPGAISRVLLQLGPGTVLPWFTHYLALLAYTTLHLLAAPVRGAVKGTAGSSTAGREAGSRTLFGARRALDAWEYGSGSDYTYHAPSSPASPPARPAKAAPVAARAATPQAVRVVSAAGGEQQPAPVPVPVPVAVTDAR